MKLTLRVITVICYFLPCTFFLATCNNGIELRFAYNKMDADKNIQLENESNEVSADTAQNDDQLSIDTIAQNNLENAAIIPSDTFSNVTHYRDRIFRKVIMPTGNSISGIGSIFYFKNLTGKIAIAISLLISLILLIEPKFLKTPRIKLYLLLAAVSCLAVFIIDSFISNVTLLWGVWTLLFLMLLQLTMEFYSHMMKAYR